MTVWWPNIEVLVFHITENIATVLRLFAWITVVKPPSIFNEIDELKA